MFGNVFLCWQCLLAKVGIDNTENERGVSSERERNKILRDPSGPQENEKTVSLKRRNPGQKPSEIWLACTLPLTPLPPDQINIKEANELFSFENKNFESTISKISGNVARDLADSLKISI